MAAELCAIGCFTIGPCKFGSPPVTVRPIEKSWPCCGKQTVGMPVGSFWSELEILNSASKPFQAASLNACDIAESKNDATATPLLKWPGLHGNATISP